LFAANNHIDWVRIWDYYFIGARMRKKTLLWYGIIILWVAISFILWIGVSVDELAECYRGVIK